MKKYTQYHRVHTLTYKIIQYKNLQSSCYWNIPYLAYKITVIEYLYIDLLYRMKLDCHIY